MRTCRRDSGTSTSRVSDAVETSGGVGFRGCGDGDEGLAEDLGDVIIVAKYYNGPLRAVRLLLANGDVAIADAYEEGSVGVLNACLEEGRVQRGGRGKTWTRDRREAEGERDANGS